MSAQLLIRLCVISRLGIAFAGAQSLLPPQAEVNSANVPANLPAQKIGADDLIAVSVYGTPELSRTVRVGADGFFRLPMLVGKVKADGLMPAQVEVRIAEALRAEQILIDPVVTVSIVEYRSRPISVAGAVRRPLTFQAFGSVTLLDAVTRAEGLTADAGSEILVSKAQKGADGNPTTLVQRIPVKGLIDAADPDLNLRLTGGEEIRVPEAGRVYVVGNIKKPGVFAIRDADETSVLKLLALSEGLMPYANDQAYIYRREGGTGGKNEIPIELKKIVDRKSPDIVLLANDILYIPEKKGKRATLATIEKILLFGGGAASAAIYAGIR
jgi:polysaccharide biosynthesis/export protein